MHFVRAKIEKNIKFVLMKRTIILVLTLLCLVSCGRIDIHIVNPTVEQQFHPQALATNQPRFSWNYETLGGIRALEPGYSKIQLKPLATHKKRL